MKRFTLLFILLAACVAGAAASAGTQARDAAPHVALQAAIKAETIDGDLKKAIALFEALAGAKDRRVAAQALLGAGRCYEKLGAAEARRAYERLVRDFADQQDSVAQARARIAALDAARVRTVATRRVGDVTTWSEYGAPALAPDGTRAAFADFQRDAVIIRDLASGDERTLRSPAGLQPGKSFAVAFSPDSRELASSWVDSSAIGAAGPPSLERIGSAVVVSDGAGATPRIVWRGNGVAIKLTWLPDRRSLLAVLAGGSKTGFDLRLIDVADGRERAVEAKLARADALALSPDGSTVAYLRANEQPRHTSTLLVRHLESGAESVAADRVRGIVNPVWTVDSRTLLFVDSRVGTGDLWLATVRNGAVQGAATLAKADIGDIMPLGVSRDGVLVYRSRQRMVSTRIAEIDPATGRVAAEPIDALSPRKNGGCGFDWAADGQSFVYAARAATDSGDECTLLVRHTLAGHRERIVSTDLVALRRPRLSPDGRFAIVTGTKGEDVYRSYRVDLTTGQSTPVGGGGAFGEWSADGRGLHLAVGDGARHRIVYHDLATGGERERYAPPENAFALYYNELAAAPDGSLALLAVRSDGRREAVVLSPNDTPRVVLQSTPPDAISFVAWAVDGKALWILRRTAGSQGGRELWRVPIDGSGPVNIGLPADIDGVRPHPDGRRLLFSSARTTAELWTLEHFLPPAK